jgi:hypothetical protein
MAEAEYLIGLAQIALGLSGFSGVVVAYRNDPSKWSDADRMRFFLLLTTSIGAVFNALLPLVFNALGINPPRLWHAASYSTLVCFAALSISYFTWLFSLKRKGKAEDVDMYLTVFLGVGSLAIMALLMLNAFGMFRGPFGVLFAALVWGLFVPAVQFGRMVYMNFVKKPKGEDKLPPFI